MSDSITFTPSPGSVADLKEFQSLSQQFINALINHCVRLEFPELVKKGVLTLPAGDVLSDGLSEDNGFAEVASPDSPTCDTLFLDEVTGRYFTRGADGIRYRAVTPAGALKAYRTILKTGNFRSEPDLVDALLDASCK